MTTRIGQFKIQQVTRKGRIRLFGNSWLTPMDGYNPDEVEIKAGRVYRFTFDDTAGTVSLIESTRHDGLSDRDHLNGLQAEEINRLEGVLQAYRDFINTLGTDTLQEFNVHLAMQAGKGRIEPESMSGEIAQMETAIMRKDAERDCAGSCGINEFSNPGLTAIMIQRDSYTGADGRRYISAGKTELYDQVSGNELLDQTCYDGI